jgi:hypothetical protein
LAHLRRLGYLAAVVERWIPGANVRRDLFGFADVLAVHPRDRQFLLVQATTRDHAANRLAKARARPELLAWLKAGGRFEVQGWTRRAGRWQVRVISVRPEDLAGVILAGPPRRGRPRRGERQQTLFVEGSAENGREWQSETT